jgi:hypothetical protein
MQPPPYAAQCDEGHEGTSAGFLAWGVVNGREHGIPRVGGLSSLSTTFHGSGTGHSRRRGGRGLKRFPVAVAVQAPAAASAMWGPGA